MGSITPYPGPSQGRASPRGQTRSVQAVRHRATVGARRKAAQQAAQWSAQVIMRAARCSHSYGLARHVLVTLLLMADGASFVSATVKEIGELAGMSREAARYHLRELRKLGDISVALRGGGRGKQNYYHLDVLDRAPADDPEPEGGDAA